MKIVINERYGGFGLSKVAEIMLLRKKGHKNLYFYKSVQDDRYNTIGYEQLTENDYVQVGENSFPTTCLKDLGKFVAIPNYQVKDDDTEKKQKLLDDFSDSYIYYGDITEDRSDKDLIDVIETIGCACASGRYSKLKIVEIPDNVDYEIDSYDGMESIHEKHRIWR